MVNKREFDFNKNRNNKDISQESFNNIINKLEECIEETIKEEKKNADRKRNEK